MEALRVNRKGSAIITAGDNPGGATWDSWSSLLQQPPQDEPGLRAPGTGDLGSVQPVQQLMDRVIQKVISNSSVTIPCGEHPHLTAVKSLPPYSFWHVCRNAEIPVADRPQWLANHPTPDENRTPVSGYQSKSHQGKLQVTEAVQVAREHTVPFLFCKWISCFQRNHFQKRLGYAPILAPIVCNIKVDAIN